MGLRAATKPLFSDADERWGWGVDAGGEVRGELLGFPDQSHATTAQSLG